MHHDWLTVRIKQGWGHDHTVVNVGIVRHDHVTVLVVCWHTRGQDGTWGNRHAVHVVLGLSHLWGRHLPVGHRHRVTVLVVDRLRWLHRDGVAELVELGLHGWLHGRLLHGNGVSVLVDLGLLLLHGRLHGRLHRWLLHLLLGRNRLTVLVILHGRHLLLLHGLAVGVHLLGRHRLAIGVHLRRRLQLRTVDA